MGEATRLGSFIRECRAGLKYTSRQVARLSNDRSGIPSISNSYLISVENGKHIPRLDKIIALADLLNVPVTHLVDRCREDLSEGCGTPDTGDFAELLAAARHHAELNDHGKALEMFRQAQQSAIHLNGSVPPAQLFELKLQMANSYRSLRIIRVAKDEIETLLKDRHLGAVERARATYVLAEIYRDEGNVFLGTTLAREALSLAREAGDEFLEAKLLSTVGKLESDAGLLDEALVRYREAATKMRKLGHERYALMARIYQGLLLVEKRDYFKAADLLRTELSHADDIDPYLRGSMHLGLAKAYYGAENLRSARTHARSARDCGETLGDPTLQFLSLFYLWQIGRRERTDEVAARHLDRLKYFRNKIDGELEEIERFDRLMKAARTEAEIERGVHL